MLLEEEAGGRVRRLGISGKYPCVYCGRSFTIPDEIGELDEHQKTLVYMFSQQSEQEVNGDCTLVKFNYSDVSVTALELFFRVAKRPLCLSEIVEAWTSWIASGQRIQREHRIPVVFNQSSCFEWFYRQKSSYFEQKLIDKLTGAVDSFCCFNDKWLPTSKITTFTTDDLDAVEKVIRNAGETQSTAEILSILRPQAEWRDKFLRFSLEIALSEDGRFRRNSKNWWFLVEWTTSWPRAGGYDCSKNDHI